MKTTKMMNTTKILILVGCLSLGLVSCGDSNPASSQDAGTNTETTTSDAEATQAPSQKALVDAKLVCREIRSMDEMIPLAEVALQLGDKKILLDSISVCQMIGAADFANNDIPQNAVSACGGWFAGGGDYFYLKYEGDEVVVMAGWQDEGQEDDGYHYKELKRFSRMQ